ncbi:MAG: SHOCT domain-containing protein [Akkermansia sp.]|nr:SHOCT domain-containing protein [Akkermansia sp.]
MGLFTTEYCPICGAKIGMMATRIKNKIAICNNCVNRVDLDYEVLPLQTLETFNTRLHEMEKNYQLFRHFNETRELKVGSYYFREDASMRRWYASYDKKPTNPTLYRYDEIIDYKLREDGDTITEGGLGRALVGGLLFGGVGAITGAITGRKKTKKEVRTLDISITLNNVYRNNITVNILPFSCKSGSWAYNQAMQNAQKLLEFLHTITSKATPQTQLEITPVSSVDEIIKFKDLMDKGIITQAEFEQKKKQILGL